MLFSICYICYLNLSIPHEYQQEKHFHSLLISSFSNLQVVKSNFVFQLGPFLVLFPIYFSYLYTALARSLLPESAPGDFNQAMMDFGAIQCTPQNPDCLTCPLASTCRALATGRVAKLPVKAPKTTVKERYLSYIYLRCNGMTAIRQRGAGDIWQGLWEPLVIEHGTTARSDGWPRWLDSQRLLPLRKGFCPQLTHRTLITDFFLYETAERPSLPDGYRWIKERDLAKVAKPRLFELLLEQLS